MSRVINPESAGKERNRLCKAIVLSLRELGKRQDLGLETQDMAAFIALALAAIDATIDPSVVAWEKRGYWVKADKFRLEWAWTGRYAASMRQAILGEDWANVARLSVEIGMKLGSIQIPDRHRMGKPWEGARVMLDTKNQSASMP